MPIALYSKRTLDDDIVDVDDGAPEPAKDDADGALSPPKPPKEPVSAVRRATVVGVVVVVALAALAGWFGYQAYQSHQAQTQRNHFVQAARQGAVNLTTIDWQRVDADVQRILDGLTGDFYNDFAMRSPPFIDVVKRVKSMSVGTVTEAGLESETADTAEVLVALTVKTSYDGVPDQDPRAWRMRISVQKVDDQVKVSNVEFVP